MNLNFLQRKSHHLGGLFTISIGALFLLSLNTLAQSAAPPVNTKAPIRIRATHLLGFESARNNCNGTLSIEDDALQFQQGGKTGAQVKIAAVLDVFLGDEGKQVGGLPMKLAKAAAPYGAGRVFSLFAHKKYDTLTLVYSDGDGGMHGAVFQLNKGKGELLRNELVARGVASPILEDQVTK